MTDKEIVERAKEAEKRMGFVELVHSPISKGVNSAFGIGFIEGMVEYRNSLQEEPPSVWHDKREKPLYNKKGDTLNMIAVAGVTKYSNGKESKECMYSKDNYTDEDRKALCDDCEEECRFNQKKGSVSKNWSAEFDKILEPYKNSHNYKKLCLILRWWKSDYERWWHWKLNQKEESGLNWKDMSLQEKKDLVAELSKDIQKEEPVSEDLEEAIEQSFIYHENRGDDFRCDEQIETSYRYGFETGANWQKEQTMAKAFDFTKEHNTACILASECLRNHGWFNRERDFNDLFRHLACVDKLFEGKFSGKTKVIVIKEA